MIQIVIQVHLTMCIFCLLFSERTEKIPMGSIKNVVSEAIEGHEEYHMLVSPSTNYIWNIL